jgi:thiamine biosynthesis protein ThiI
VPFESIQREIVSFAPEKFRILLYRRMMMRIAEQLARRSHALALVTGDSLGQVASQTLQNMVAVGDAVRMPVFRPLAGTDKQEIVSLARQIGTYDISSEPFHECCPAFMPRMPALYSKPKQLEAAEAGLDVGALVHQGVKDAICERFRYAAGQVEDVSAEEAGVQAPPNADAKTRAVAACGVQQEIERD